MFAGLVTQGVNITKLNELDRLELNKIVRTQPFKVGMKIMKKQVQINLDPEDLHLIIPFIKKSYKRAIKET